MPGSYAQAVQPYTQCVRICRELGPSWQLAASHLNLGAALLHTGRIEDAVDAFEEALRLYRDLGDHVFAARVLNHLAHVALARDDLARADRLARLSLAGAAEHGERQGTAEALETLAALAAQRTQPERAAELAGAAATIREAIASRAAPFDTAIAGRIIDAAEARTDPEQWSHAWNHGRGLNRDEAVAHALGEHDNNAARGEATD